MKMNENTEKKDDDSSVRVALRIRPQLAREKIDMCQVCTNVVHGEPQVMIGKDKSFTFDFVFDLEVTQETIYHSCVKDLIEGCFEGYNATIFAYGQTGSGKTYTMGTGFDINISEEEVGIIPRAVDHLFRGIEECRAAAIQRNEPPPDFKVNTQFMEIYNEEIIDLLDTTRDPESRRETTCLDQPVFIGRRGCLSRQGRKSHIKIHEDAGGGIYVVGVTTKPVSSLNDTLQCLQIGSLSRATASTNMNSQSSRSHAIFTLHIKQTRVSTEESFIDDEDGQDAEPQQEFETLTAKFHFVDLAGSERLKRTGATGDRAKEGISINCGLLALGNVISALGDKAKRGSHVPYRDSKLTRLLQDSLGGNSRTLMIACISPSDRDFMETLNTLQYANRARNIRNKVIANQDKASKQLAVLRTEILKLQEELMEYKTGKRIVDKDGTEVISDVHNENKMLMNENDKLRQRVKALNEALESLTARNAQLMIEKATLNLGNAGGDAACEEVTKLVEGYVKEMEELRAKLAEAQSMADIMKKSTSRTTSRLSLSMMMSPMLSPVPASNSYEMPLSPEYTTSVLDDAKKDVQRLKKMMRSQSRLSHESDKENKRTDDEKEKNEEVTEKQTDEKLEKETEQEVYDGLDEEEMEREEEEEEQLNLNDEEEDVDGDGEDESSSDSEAKDSDNVHEDLAELTCEISIKQRLIEELELTQRRLHSLKSQYEEKVLQLQAKIKETELERDKVLANINQVENVTAEKAKKVRDEFERKLNDMQSELKKLNAAKKEHSKLIRNQSHYEKQLKTLQHELAEMKKTKVRLMKQIKEDSDKTKQSEARRNKELAQLRKEQLKKETRIRTLEQEKKQRELVLKRKQEEVETLRKRPKPMSSKVAGRVGQYSRPNTIPIAPVTSSPRRRRRGTAEFSAKAAKQKWDTLEKNVTSLINKKQTVTNIERDMDVWLKQREKFVKKLEKYMKEKDKAVEAGKSEEEIKEMTDVIESLNNQVEFAQDNIYECQTNIMQVEETNNGMETADTSLLVSSCNLEEARYLLEHFINLTITKGLALAAKESENREMLAKLHQTELNNTLQQDLLKHMMLDRVDVEVDNLMTNQADDMDSSTSSCSSSPVDSMFESKIESSQSIPVVPVTSSSPADLVARREKVRRRTATPEELLYVSTDPPTLHPVPETVDEHHAEKEAIRIDGVLPLVNGNVEATLMPPPKSLPPRQNSGSGLHRVSSAPSPSLRRKEFTRPSPEPSPVLRRKNNSTSLLTRSNSLDNTTTSSDTTPPSSPQLTRRSERTTDENVFSRLTGSAVTSPNALKRGAIVPATSRMNTTRSSPLMCSHVAEGHTKAVLSVCASEDWLFTGSKDRTAKAWDIQTGKEFMSFAGHPNNVTVVKYCQSRKLLFTVCQSYISVWDLREKSSKCIKTLSSSGLTQNGPVNFSTTRQIDLTPGDHVSDIMINPSGDLIYGATGNVVRVWDLRTFIASRKLSGGHQAAIMVLAVDQKEDSDVLVTGSKDHYIKVFEVMKDTAGILTPKYNLEPPHYDGIQSLTLQGDILFSGSRDTCIKKWDLSTQKLVQSVNSAHKDWICAMSFMPGNNVLLSGCRAGYLKLWQIDSCIPVAEIKAHVSPINSIATNSAAIFTASNDHTVRIWKQKPGFGDPSDSSDNVADDRQSSSSS